MTDGPTNFGKSAPDTPRYIYIADSTNVHCSVTPTHRQPHFVHVHPKHFFFTVFLHCTGLLWVHDIQTLLQQRCEHFHVDADTTNTSGNPQRVSLCTVRPLFFFSLVDGFFLSCLINVGQNKNKVAHFHDVGQIKL